jgi:hypothetical protein
MFGPQQNTAPTDHDWLKCSTPSPQISDTSVSATGSFPDSSGRCPRATSSGPFNPLHHLSPDLSPLIDHLAFAGDSTFDIQRLIAAILMRWSEVDIAGSAV